MTQRLFAGVYLDEDVSVLIASVLKSRGFIVETARDAGTLGQSDNVQLEYAVTHALALMTHNRRDFEALHHDYAARQQTHWGIVIPARRRPYEIARRLLRLLDAFTADELKNQLIYLWATEESDARRKESAGKEMSELRNILRQCGENGAYMLVVHEGQIVKLFRTIDVHEGK